MNLNSPLQPTRVFPDLITSRPPRCISSEFASLHRSFCFQGSVPCSSQRFSPQCGWQERSPPLRLYWSEQTDLAAVFPGRRPQMVAHMPRNYLECSCFSANKLTNLTVRTGPWQSKGSLGPKVPLDLRGQQNYLTCLLSIRKRGTVRGSGLVK